MKTGPKCAGYHTYWTMVTLMRSAREVQTTSSGRIIGGTVLGHLPRSSHHPPNQGVPSRQTVWSRRPGAAIASNSPCGGFPARIEVARVARRPMPLSCCAPKAKSSPRSRQPMRRRPKETSRTFGSGHPALAILAGVRPLRCTYSAFAGNPQHSEQNLSSKGGGVSG